MGKYYKYQKPGRTAFWTFVLPFLVRLPGFDMAVIEHIIRSSMGEINFDPTYGIPLGISLFLFIFLVTFKKKHPRSVAIVGNCFMLVLLGYAMTDISVAITEFGGNLLIDADTIIASLEAGDGDTIQMVANGAISFFLFIASFRVVKRTRKSFADCEPEEDSTILALWALAILAHLVAIASAIPAFFTAAVQFTGSSIYAGMFGLLRYLFPIFFMIKAGLGAWKTIKELKLRGRRNAMGFKEALIIVIFVFSLFPIFGHFVDQGQNTRPNSVYNTTWAGNSEFKALVEDKGFETYSIQSSLSAMLSLNRSVCFVAFGPSKVYNPLSEIPFFLELLSNENTDVSFLICDDHGSTSFLSAEMAAIAATTDYNIPVALFTDGTLRDNQSCKVDSGTGLKDNSFPIINNLDSSHPICSGVSEVILSEATAMVDYSGLLEGLGWDVIGRSSPLYSWVDKDNNGYYNDDKDYWGLTDELNFTLMGADISLQPKVELAAGDDGLAVFTAAEITSNSRIVMTSDASMFNNELLYEYDNLQFAENIIDWLTSASADDMVFVFDESHNIPRGTREFSSAAMFGLIQGYVNWLSQNPFLSWLYPLWALRTLRKYIPKEKSKKKKKKKEEEESDEEIEELKFRTSSFFAQKINWYRVNKEYNQALKLLYRRVERKIHGLMGTEQIDVDRVISKIESDRGKYIKKDTLKRMRKFLERMDDIKHGKEEITETEEFNEVFFEMNWFMETL